MLVLSCRTIFPYGVSSCVSNHTRDRMEVNPRASPDLFDSKLLIGLDFDFASLLQSFLLDES